MQASDGTTITTTAAAALLSSKKQKQQQQQPQPQERTSNEGPAAVPSPEAAVFSEVDPQSACEQARGSKGPAASIHGDVSRRENDASGVTGSAAAQTTAAGSAEEGARVQQAAARDGDSGAVPRVLLLRHRMGYSTVELTKKQRSRFTRSTLEEFLLYKEQKYNAVNVLGRFAVFLLVVSTFAIFCLLFSMSSTDWQVVRYEGLFRGMGIFVTCHERVLRQCTRRSSSFFTRTLTDAVTGQTVCSVSRGMTRGYIGSMWTMGILHLLGQAVSLCLNIHVACRPTRHKALVWIVWIFLATTVAGIINCVLFHFYVRCDRKVCVARHEEHSKAACDRYYGWGYDAYIAATALHALCFFMAFAMYSYIHQIRTKARLQLQEERRRKRVEEAAENFVQSIMEDRTTAAVGEGGGGSVAGYHRSRNAASANLGNTFASVSGILGPAAAAAAAREMNGVTITREGDPGKPIKRNGGGGFTLQHTIARSKPGGKTASGRPLGAPALSSTYTHVNPNRRNSSSLAGPRGPSHQGSFAHVSETPTPPRRGAAALAGQQETVEYRAARRQHKRLAHIFDRDYDPAYLTAAELGVSIDGATDWLYDDRSDMYYSFSRNMFWDPLTGEYFNCVLRTWQENPDSIVDIRDAMEYAWEDGLDYDGDGYADYDDDPEQQLSDDDSSNNGSGSNGGAIDDGGRRES